MARHPVSRQRALHKIDEAGERRAREIAEFIVAEIAGNPDTPYDPQPDGAVHLRDSYHVKKIEGTGDYGVYTDLRYWAFVEFGTREHGSAQPHVRPAIEAARARYR